MGIISKALYISMMKAGSFVEYNFIKDTKNAYDVNRNLLMKILKNNSNTRIGIDFNFKNISSIESYKKNIPLTDYNFYENYISLILQGNSNILCKEPITFFGRTSGTTGKQKLIPFTKSRTKTASKYMGLLTEKFSYNNFKNSWNYGKGLMLSDMIIPELTPSGIPICSATSGGMNSIKFLFPFIFTSPIEVLQIHDKDTALYLHLLFALKESNLLYISGIFISNILDLLRCLETNYDNLVNDIKKGVLSSNLNLDKNTLNALNKKLSPNASRAVQLESYSKDGFKGICKRIWPSLTFIATVTGGTFSIYDEKVNYYTGNLPIHSTAYAATESTIGINPNINKISYVITPDSSFFEFIPIEESYKTNPSTYTLNELKINSEYEIVVTNTSGLYRYRIGDVIKVIGYYNNSPEIQFMYRKNQLLNMVAEKTTEEHITSTLSNIRKILDCEIIDYTTMQDNSISPGRYVFFLELHSKTIYSESYLSSIIDTQLKLSNMAYGRFRNSKRLSPPKIVLLPLGTFKDIKELLFKKGASKNQVKIPRVITKDSDIYSKLITESMKKVISYK